MGFILGFFLIIIIIVGIWFIVDGSDNKKIQKGINEMYPEYKYFKLRNGYILINKEGKLIWIPKDDVTYILSGNLDYKEAHKAFTIKNINSYEIYKNGKGVHSGTRTAVGTLLFGVPGAIIGSSSGKGKVLNMGINLFINDFDNPLLKLEFLELECKSGDGYYNVIKNKIEEFISLLKYAETNANKPSEEVAEQH